MSMIHIRVMGAPRTKKTSNMLVKVGKEGQRRSLVLPSKAWRAWCSSAQIVEVKTDGLWAWPLSGRELPEAAYNCRAHFYRDANRGDAVGYYQGLADLLEKRGIVVNDKWITQWDGSRLFLDRANPRVELTLEQVA